MFVSLTRIPFHWAQMEMKLETPPPSPSRGGEGVGLYLSPLSDASLCAGICSHRFTFLRPILAIFELNNEKTLFSFPFLAT